MPRSSGARARTGYRECASHRRSWRSGGPRGAGGDPVDPDRGTCRRPRRLRAHLQLGKARRQYHRGQHPCDRTRREEARDPEAHRSRGTALCCPERSRQHGARAPPGDRRPGADVLGIELQTVDVHGPADIVPAFASFRAEGAEAIDILASPLLNSTRKELDRLSLEYRLPAICQFREAVEVGCLASYGVRLSDALVMTALTDKMRPGRPRSIAFSLAQLPPPRNR